MMNGGGEEAGWKPEGERKRIRRDRRNRGKSGTSKRETGRCTSNDHRAAAWRAAESSNRGTRASARPKSNDAGPAALLSRSRVRSRAPPRRAALPSPSRRSQCSQFSSALAEGKVGNHSLVSNASAVVLRGSGTVVAEREEAREGIRGCSLYARAPTRPVGSRRRSCCSCAPSLGSATPPPSPPPSPRTSALASTPSSTKRQKK